MDFNLLTFWCLEFNIDLSIGNSNGQAALVMNDQETNKKFVLKASNFDMLFNLIEPSFRRIVRDLKTT